MLRVADADLTVGPLAVKAKSKQAGRLVSFFNLNSYKSRHVRFSQVITIRYRRKWLLINFPSTGCLSFAKWTGKHSTSQRLNQDDLALWAHVLVLHFRT